MRDLITTILFVPSFAVNILLIYSRNVAQVIPKAVDSSYIELWEYAAARIKADSSFLFAALESASLARIFTLVKDHASCRENVLYATC